MAHADRLLTTEQVAQELQVSPRTVQSWRSEGVGPPFVRLGRRVVRYRRSAVDEFLDAHEREPLEER